MFNTRGKQVSVMGFGNGEGILNLTVARRCQHLLNSWYRLSVIHIDR